MTLIFVSLASLLRPTACTAHHQNIVLPAIHSII